MPLQKAKSKVRSMKAAFPFGGCTYFRFTYRYIQGTHFLVGSYLFIVFVITLDGFLCLFIGASEAEILKKPVSPCKLMEPTKTPSYGKSILVPSVQELAKEPRDSVPERYLRLDQHLQTISSPNSQLQIPVVDFGKLLNAESMASELEKLHSACVHWGFFQLVNHGVSSSLVEKMKLEVQGFFNLPIEKKKKLWQQPGEVEGFGQAFVVSEEQKLDWADMFFLTTLPPSMRKSHLYDNLPPSFRETMDAYGVELLKLAFTLTGQMAMALGMEEREMSDLFEEGFQALRMNYYPPCPQPEKVIGLTPHSDAVGLTLLLQVNEMEGLQIRKDGKWIPVRPLPDAFIVNIGDILEIVSNGTYRSIEHRGVVNSAKERLSVAAFHSPKMTAEIGPAPSLISQERPALFKRVGVEKYFKELFSRKLDGKSYLDYLRIDEEKSKDGVVCDHLSGSV